MGAGEARTLASSVFRRRLMPPYWAGPKIAGGWARRRTAKTGVAFTPILLTTASRIGPIFCLGWKTLAEPV